MFALPGGYGGFDIGRRYGLTSYYGPAPQWGGLRSGYRCANEILA